MREKLHSPCKSDIYPVAVKDVLVQSVFGVVRRVDRVAMALCLVALTGLGLEKLIASGAHAVVVIFTAGISGNLLMFACIAIISARAEYLKPDRNTWKTCNSVALVAVTLGSLYGIVMSVAWFVLPEHAALLPGFYFGHEWRAWHLLGTAAITSCILPSITMYGWPLAVMSNTCFAHAWAASDRYRNLEDLYDQRIWWGNVGAGFFVAATVPVLCMLVPVWYAVTISRLFEQVWKNRVVSGAEG